MADMTSKTTMKWSGVSGTSKMFLMSWPLPVAIAAAGWQPSVTCCMSHGAFARHILHTALACLGGFAIILQAHHSSNVLTCGLFFMHVWIHAHGS